MPQLLLSAGVDEAGRGPLAGPVVAAAVILNKPIPGLNDSKKLSDRKRRLLAEQIKNEARAFSIAAAAVDEIDKLNIHKATLLAMARAIESLPMLPDEILCDGKFLPDTKIQGRAVVNGDELVPQISAASIIAKVSRDDDMLKLHDLLPDYGFAQHKGYGTKMHLEALKSLGPSVHHRRSFKPVKECLLLKQSITESVS